MSLLLFLENLNEKDYHLDFLKPGFKILYYKGGFLCRMEIEQVMQVLVL